MMDTKCALEQTVLIKEVIVDGDEQEKAIVRSQVLWKQNRKLLKLAAVQKQ